MPFNPVSLMIPEVDDIIKSMEKLAPPRQVFSDQHEVVHTYQTLYMARLMVLLAKEEEKRSELLKQEVTTLIGIAEAQRILAKTLERQTKWLIGLTWGLFFLTLALLIREVITPKDRAANEYNSQIETNPQIVVPVVTNR